MPKKHEKPKLNIIAFHYNGDQNTFEKFLSSMAADYINSDILPEYIRYNFVDCVDFSKTEAIPLDK